ncbi:GlxA family transcriptional regulator [Mesorhizobium sp. M0047]|uniref:GlxA family transcriptional regulator n=1 Tax=Mesorhizobium sp. M0047 TaxID=2956859 RepID=UPI00333B92D5
MEIVILVLPGSSSLCVASVIEPLVMANQISGRDIFTWRIIGVDQHSAHCSGDVLMAVSDSIVQERRNVENRSLPFAAVVCGGTGVENHCTPSAIALVRLYSRHGTQLLGVDTGAWLLAKAGLIQGKRCTINRRMVPAFSEAFANTSVEKGAFIADGAIATCVGGYAPLAMMLTTIEENCGSELARSISNQLDPSFTFGLNGLSGGKSVVGSASKLDHAIRLMEDNLEDCLPLKAVAGSVKISRRQLERLFRTYVGMTPSRYYRNLRLSRARHLLDTTDMTILSIAVACGFVSSSHFSQVFREHFGQGPSTLRVNARSQWANSLLAKAMALPPDASLSPEP